VSSSAIATYTKVLNVWNLPLAEFISHEMSSLMRIFSLSKPYMKMLVLDSGKRSSFFLNTFEIPAKGRQLVVVQYLLMNILIIMLVKLWLVCSSPEKKTVSKTGSRWSQMTKEMEACQFWLQDKLARDTRRIP
jgi:hypothetical protein